MKFAKLVCALLIVSAPIQNAYSWGLSDLTDSASDLTDSASDLTKDCNGDKKCEKDQDKARIIAAGTAAAAIIAAMVINYKSEQTQNEESVRKEYLKTNKNIPDYSTTVSYESNSLNKSVVAGKKVTVKSESLVIPGMKDKTAKIVEKLVIYDNTDSSIELSSLEKPVNPAPHSAGRYNSEFSFTLPEGMPQGVYPVKTTLILNGKEVREKYNNVQLVIQIDHFGTPTIQMAGL